MEPYNRQYEHERERSCELSHLLMPSSSSSNKGGDSLPGLAGSSSLSHMVLNNNHDSYYYNCHSSASHNHRQQQQHNSYNNCTSMYLSTAEFPGVNDHLQKGADDYDDSNRYLTAAAHPYLLPFSSSRAAVQPPLQQFPSSGSSRKITRVSDFDLTETPDCTETSFTDDGFYEYTENHHTSDYHSQPHYDNHHHDEYDHDHQDDFQYGKQYHHPHHHNDHHRPQEQEEESPASEYDYDAAYKLAIEQSLNEIEPVEQPGPLPQEYGQQETSYKEDPSASQLAEYEYYYKLAAEAGRRRSSSATTTVDRKILSKPTAVYPEMKKKKLSPREQMKSETFPHLDVEIAPGEYRVLRGSEETKRAIHLGYTQHVDCMICELKIVCVADCEMVLCPVCRMISPVFPSDDGSEQSRYGVGLGVKLR